MPIFSGGFLKLPWRQLERSEAPLPSGEGPASGVVSFSERIS
jgi:hypothetical protein